MCNKKNCPIIFLTIALALPDQNCETGQCIFLNPQPSDIKKSLHVHRWILNYYIAIQ